ncbi:hypothetical protein [Microbulbifer epialgicus]|uniref:Secreted protein n=1 Tax=Microbulbifer epialgicus TaxID=393907 RepID=A0ABV4P0Y1_9GAMM
MLLFARPPSALSFTYRALLPLSAIDDCPSDHLNDAPNQCTNNNQSKDWHLKHTPAPWAFNGKQQIELQESCVLGQAKLCVPAY